jgi:predicted translin family RNA/ssDNA-binding protein
VSVHDEEVQRLFRDMFAARRIVAQHQEDLRRAESAVQGAQEALEEAKRGLNDIEQRIQRLAERAAGVDPRRDDGPERPLRSEYTPIRR